MKKLAIIGSGDLGQQIAYHATNDKQFEVVGFYDDFAEIDKFISGYKVLGKLSIIQKDFKNNIFDQLIIGIGYKHLNFKEELYNSLKGKVEFATLIHSSCYVDASSKIGKGVCMLPGSVVDQNVVIEDNVLVNIGCKISHDSTVKTHSFLSPSVAIAGFVDVGVKCNIGINTTIIDNIKITDEVTTGGGTVVIKDITKKGVYVGNPARFIR